MYTYARVTYILQKRFLFLTGLLAAVLLFSTTQTSYAQTAPSYPTTPPAQICSNSSLLDGGPATAPDGAVTVPAGDNHDFFVNESYKHEDAAGTVYWFAPGVHTLGTDEFGQIIPASNTTFVGAPGAILDGQNVNHSAFTGQATGVTIKYLTVQNFNSYMDQGVVNHDSGAGWIIEYNTVTNNHGAGVFLGNNNTLKYNCLKDNGQYGFQGFGDTMLIDHNEVAGNNTDDLETSHPGCGCTGGSKFWAASHATITNNWVHHNKSMGLWADTNNRDFLIEGNYINDNDGSGLEYEISYNIVVKNNNFVRNAITAGLRRQTSGDPFPEGAIYLSESGGDSRVTSTVTGTSNLEVYNNNFQDNWDGVVLWENPNRFGNDNSGNTSKGYTTLVVDSNNSGYNSPNMYLCGDPANGGQIATEPYYSNCRWKTQNVKVHDNTFSINPANIGCTGNGCGRQGLFSADGGCATCTAWWPYQGQSVENALTFNQGNVFSNNTYVGSWKFTVFDMGRVVDYSTWRAAPYNQDASSSCPDCTSVVSPTPTPAGPTATPTPVSGGPTTPQNFHITNVTSDRVDFAWDASTDEVAPVTGYAIHRNGAEVGTTGSTNGTDFNPVAGQTYTYTVEAYSDGDSYRHSAPSVPVTVTIPGGPDTTAPSVPANVTGTSVSDSQVNLTWNSSTDDVGVAGYNVYRDGTKVNTTVVTTTSFGDTGLTRGTAYHYTVSAVDYAGNESTNSSSVTVTTGPTPPTNFRVTNLTSSEVDFAWDASTDTNAPVTGYAIHRDGVEIGTTGDTDGKDWAPVPGQTYTYTVEAYSDDDDYRHSPVSNELTVTIPPDTTAPSIPTGLAGTSVSDTQINLTWNASSDTGGAGFAGYNVYRNGTKINTSGVITDTSFGDTGLTRGVNYSYTVSAVDNAGNESAQSPVVAVTTGPTPPTNFRVTNLTSSEVDFAWDASTNTNASVTGYAIHRDGVEIGTTGDTDGKDWEPVPGQTYTYTVEAYSDDDSYRHSPVSNQLTVTIPN